MEETTHRQKVLIVDDERDMLSMLQKVVSRKCLCEVHVAASGGEALDHLHNCHPDIVITDIKMPDINGLELLEKIIAFDQTISTIIMTAYGTIEMAVHALKMGAYDFIEKPFDNDKIILAVQRAIERTLLLRENLNLQKMLREERHPLGFVGRSPRLRQTIDLLTRLATSDATVLIRGESGTGKELAARALHTLSKRAANKMVIVNCPAIPEQILESELFGYHKGAFTGADTDKQGLFMEADGSTILLDEIADIPLSVQTKLLRVLQEKEIQPLGQTKRFKVDVRVIASTNQDLEKKMRNGEFREDLYYRLNVMTVTMPTLEEIVDDIPILAQHFLGVFSNEYGRKGLEFTPAALQCLMSRKWKGNVRELQNTINRAVLLCSGDKITPADLMTSAENNKDSIKGVSSLQPCCMLHLPYSEAKEEMVSHFAVSYLKNALINNYGNVSAAARKSGMERQAFQRLLRRYGIRAGEFKKH